MSEQVLLMFISPAQFRFVLAYGSYSLVFVFLDRLVNDWFFTKSQYFRCHFLILFFYFYISFSPAPDVFSLFTKS